MKPSLFELLTPSTLDEAIAMLAQHGDNAKLISGGQSLVPAMNMRLANPKVLIDLNGINNLGYIRREGDEVVIGGLTRHRAVETSPLLREVCPLLPDAASLIGHLAIRYRGTIGGSLAHCDPAATLPTATLALDGSILAVGPDGERRIPLSEFFYGIFTTSLGPTEILTEIRLPIPAASSGHAFMALTRKHGDFPLVSVAVLLTLGGVGIQQIRLVVGGVNAIPTRMEAAEALLTGKEPSTALWAEAADLVAGALDPETDLHATAEYRLHIAKIYVKRALAQALERAKGGVGA